MGRKKTNGWKAEVCPDFSEAGLRRKRPLTRFVEHYLRMDMRASEQRKLPETAKEPGKSEIGVRLKASKLGLERIDDERSESVELGRSSSTKEIRALDIHSSIELSVGLRDK